MLDCAQLRSQFSEIGYISGIKILTQEQLTHSVGLLENITKGSSEEIETLTIKSHQNYKFLNEIATNSNLLNVIECLIGPDILLFDSTVIVKEPNDGLFASWHQDSAYAPFIDKNILTVWVALTEYTEKNGCLRVIPRSHKRGVRPHIESTDKHNILSRGQEIEITAKELAESRNVKLRPGEISVHHLDLIHNSSPNVSTASRISMGIIFFSPSTKPKSAQLSARLVRGQDQYGYYQPT